MHTVRAPTAITGATTRTTTKAVLHATDPAVAVLAVVLCALHYKQVICIPFTFIRFFARVASNFCNTETSTPPPAAGWRAASGIRHDPLLLW